MKMCCYLLILAFAHFTQVTGLNIVRGKFTDQSSTINVDYMSYKAVDGSLTSGCSSTSPYEPDWWQVDLMGFYRLTRISVRPPANHGANLRVGASTISVRCADSQVVQCGEWPIHQTSEMFINFACSLNTPVRFIRLWKTTNSYLRLVEVHATGALAAPTALRYDLQHTGWKYIYPRRTLNVSVVNECASACFFTPYCVGFSFREGGSDNCLIVPTCRNLVVDAQWNIYKVDDQPTFCD